MERTIWPLAHRKFPAKKNATFVSKFQSCAWRRRYRRRSSESRRWDTYLSMMTKRFSVFPPLRLASERQQLMSVAADVWCWLGTVNGRQPLVIRPRRRRKGRRRGRRWRRRWWSASFRTGECRRRPPSLGPNGVICSSRMLMLFDGNLSWLLGMFHLILVCGWLFGSWR